MLISSYYYFKKTISNRTTKTHLSKSACKFRFKYCSEDADIDKLYIKLLYHTRCHPFLSIATASLPGIENRTRCRAATSNANTFV